MLVKGRLRRAVLSIVLAGSAAIAVPAPAYAAPISTRHAIVCDWVNVGPPYRPTTSSTAVNGAVHVRCSDRLDDANTNAQLQFASGSSAGPYANWGNSVTSYSTAIDIHVIDGAPGKRGYWRVRGQHFGQHGNMFALPNYYSVGRYLVY